MRIIDEALIGLIGARDEQAVYEAVVKAVHELELETYVAASALTQDGCVFRVTATAGLDGLLGQLRKLFGEVRSPSPSPSRSCAPRTSPATRPAG